MKICLLAILPTLRFVLEKHFESLGQGWRPVWIAQFVDDHGSGKRFAEQSLRDAHVRINAGGINDPHATARDRGDAKAAIFSAG